MNLEFVWPSSPQLRAVAPCRALYITGKTHLSLHDPTLPEARRTLRDVVGYDETTHSF